VVYIFSSIDNYDDKMGIDMSDKHGDKMGIYMYHSNYVFEEEEQIYCSYLFRDIFK